METVKMIYDCFELLLVVIFAWILTVGVVAAVINQMTGKDILNRFSQDYYYIAYFPIQVSVIVESIIIVIFKHKKS